MAESPAASGRTAYIVGSGGQSRVVASLLPHRRIRLLVERHPGPDDLLQEAFFALASPPDGDYFIGIGDNAIRRRYFDRLKAFGVTLANCIAPTAWVAGSATLGEGVFVGAGAVIGPDARIGDNAIVNNLALVDHDSVVGEDSHIAPGALVGAEVRIGRGCFLGLNSTVVSRVDVGEGAYLMAGAVVIREVACGSRVGGVPARPMPRSSP